MKVIVKNLDNTKLLIARNNNGNKRRYRMSKGVIPYEFKETTLNLDGIKKILHFIASVHNRYPGVSVRMHIDMGAVVAADKLAITLLECIAYSLWVDCRHRVSMRFRFEHTIFTECIKHSPLRYLGSLTQENVDRFFKCFASDLRMDHFRRIIGADAAEDGTLSDTMTDVLMFLKHQHIDREYSTQLAEVIAELIGNATEHSHTSCLLDVDFSSSYNKRLPDGAGGQKQQDGMYVGVSVSMISLSQIAFEDGIRNKLADASCHTARYARAAEALKRHSKFFTENYTINDFYRIVAFQDRISGRIGETTSGGTGLTTLVKSLADHSDSDRCYLLAGNRILYFDKSLLDHDADGWIGFNKTNDFFNNPPAPHILQRSSVTMPGVAYNLNFVCRKETAYEEHFSQV